MKIAIMTGLILFAAMQAGATSTSGFNTLIAKAEVEQTDAHMKAMPKEDKTVTAYNNDWLKLRQSKKTALANNEVDVRLTPYHFQH